MVRFLFLFCVLLQGRLSQIHLGIDSTITALTCHSINQLRKLIPSINRKSGLPHDKLSPPTIPHIASSHLLSPHKQVLSRAKFLTLLADEKPVGRSLFCTSHLCPWGSSYSFFDIPLPSPVNRYEYKLRF
jgi:hypothetical protein